MGSWSATSRSWCVELPLRAAHWCLQHGLAEAAIGYAMDAGDADLVARGVEQAAIGVYRSGRLATVQRWFDWFDDHGLIQQYPAVAMLGAWIQALGGHAAAAERWADAAERGSYEGMLPDGSASIDGWRALLRAKLCRHGVTQMRADAELALTLIPVGSLWRAPAQLLLGISHLLAGDLGVADDVLAEAVEVAQDTGATLAASVALAERAILAIGRQDWQDAETLVEQARSVVGKAHLEDCVTSVVVYAAAARVAIHHGNRGPGRAGPGPGPAAAATGHPRPALLRGPGPAGADPCLPRPDRRGRCPDGASRGRRPAAVAARPRHPPRPGQPATRPTRPPPRRSHRRRRRLPPPSCACFRCWPPTSPFARWASNCTCPSTR